MLEVFTKDAHLELIARRLLYGIATPEELQSIKPEDVFAIKTDESELHIRSAVEPVVEVEKAAAAGDARTRKFVASDESVDRYGDIIRVAGWDFTHFKKNPVALWAHDSSSTPIGIVTDMVKGEVKGKPALLESIRYFEEKVNPMSETLLRLIDAGGVRAVSVGFIPRKWNRPETPEERQKMGLGPYGVEFTKQEQIELSNCSIPANPAALISKSLVPMVREMEQRGQLSRDCAADFYRAVDKLESGRRVFALGASGTSSGPGGATEAKAAAPSPVAAPVAAPAEPVPDAAVEQRKSEDELAREAEAAAGDAPTEPTATETSTSTLEARVAQLERELAETKQHLARLVGVTDALLDVLGNNTSDGDGHTSGAPGQKTATDDTKDPSYLAGLFGESLLSNLNR